MVRVANLARLNESRPGTGCVPTTGVTIGSVRGECGRLPLRILRLVVGFAVMLRVMGIRGRRIMSCLVIRRVR